VACPWISTSCVALAANAVRWRIEQAEAFRDKVEHDTDAERVILADAYEALLRHGPLAHPPSRWWSTGSAIRAGDAYTLVLPRVVVGDQVLGDTSVVHAVDLIGRG
jgi:hypothetical protein